MGVGGGANEWEAAGMAREGHGGRDGGRVGGKNDGQEGRSEHAVPSELLGLRDVVVREELVSILLQVKCKATVLDHRRRSTWPRRFGDVRPAELIKLLGRHGKLNPRLADQVLEGAVELRPLHETAIVLIKALHDLEDLQAEVHTHEHAQALPYVEALAKALGVHALDIADHEDLVASANDMRIQGHAEAHLWRAERLWLARHRGRHGHWKCHLWMRPGTRRRMSVGGNLGRRGCL